MYVKFYELVYASLTIPGDTGYVFYGDTHHHPTPRRELASRLFFITGCITAFDTGVSFAIERVSQVIRDSSVGRAGDC